MMNNAETHEINHLLLLITDCQCYINQGIDSFVYIGIVVFMYREFVPHKLSNLVAFARTLVSLLVEKNNIY